MKIGITAMTVLALGACSPSVESNEKMDTSAENQATIAPQTTTAPENTPVAEKTATDSRIWLEEVEGEKPLAWVRGENERSLARLEADPRFAELNAAALSVVNATDKIAYGRHRGGFVYNFWQDADNVHGIWRRTPLGEYALGEPNWDVLIDFDALSEAEGENWVYKGSSCLAPNYDKCIITVSRGGKDASVRREFDLASKSFVEDGFVIPESKGGFAWVDADTLMVATDWGDGTMTDSGYPFVVKLWERGTPLADATTVLTGDKTDVAVSAFRVEMDDRGYMFAAEADTFYDTTWWYLPEGAAPVKLPVPSKTSVRAQFAGQAIFSLEDEWTHQGN
ncbi:Prolyl endopeptidase, partial [hydrothermal vent metagenome]